MVPESHPVFAEARLAYRVIILEQELLRLEALHDDQWATINYLADQVKKHEERSTRDAKALSVLLLDRDAMKNTIQKTLIKSDKIWQHLGHFTNLTLKRLSVLDNRVDKLEEQIHDLTSSFARLSVSDRRPQNTQ